MKGADGRQFNTSRPSMWQQAASDCVHDLQAYAAFVHGLPPAPHHDIIDERLEYGSKWEIILGPPACAKSTRGRMAAERRLGRRPNYRWLIVSEIVSGPATTWTSDIGSTISNNERFRFVFGDLKGESKEWSSRSLRFRDSLANDPPPPPWLVGVPGVDPKRGRTPGSTGPNVRAIGWRMGIQGIRCDGIISDDIVSDRSSNSTKLTAQIVDAFHRRILSRLSSHPEETVWVFGQRFMPRDFYGYLIEHAMTVGDTNPDLAGMQVLEGEVAA